MIKLTCSDLPLHDGCCYDCHHSGKLLNYYPFDVYGVIKDKRLLKVWLEYCCAHVHLVKTLPISFWTDILKALFDERIDEHTYERSESDYLEDFLT